MDVTDFAWVFLAMFTTTAAVGAYHYRAAREAARVLAHASIATGLSLSAIAGIANPNLFDAFHPIDLLGSLLTAAMGWAILLTLPHRT